MKTNQEPLYWVTTKSGKHIPVFDKDPKKNAEIIKAYKSKRVIEPDAYVEPFTRMANHLAKQGISNEDEIENYLKGLSATRRSKLAREMGIESRGSDKIKEMAHRIYLAGKKDTTPTPTPKPEPPKKEELKKEPLKASEIKEMYENRNKKADTPNFPQEYESILGKKKDVDPIEQLTKCNEGNFINPHYRDWDDNKSFAWNNRQNKGYKTNCALCSTTGALQARGYDVEAMPRDFNQWRGPYTIFEYDYTNPDNFIAADNEGGHFRESKKIRLAKKNKYAIPDNAPYTQEDMEKIATMPRGANAAAEAIIERVKKWGHGAIGELSVKWKGTSTSHSILVINQRGHVFIWDAQNNKIESNIVNYLKDTIANHSQLIRLDNAPLKKGIEKELEKMVKVRDTSVNGQINKVLDKIDWDKF